MKKILIISSALLLAFGCTKPGVTPKDEPKEKPDTAITPDPQHDTIPKEPSLDNYVPVPAEGHKIATLWIDLSANIKKLSSKKNALTYLDLIQDSGFNAIVLDVKPVAGVVMYDSDFLEKATVYNRVDISTLDYDYLPFFIEECHKRNMRITVSTCVMTMGDGSTGPGYTDPWWDDKFCLEYLPKGLSTATYRDDGLVDIRYDRDNGIFGFLIPSHPDVHDYVIKMAKELVTKYDFDGYALDYCRYQDYNSDFSQISRKAFEEYIGEAVPNWPDDIYTWGEGVTSRTGFTAGPYYSRWCEWKASVIQGYIRDISEAVHSIKPEVDLELWASAWWPLPGTGQNWAYSGNNRTSSYWWATPDYYKTGFAEYLDIFQCGAYTHQVHGGGTESIEGLVSIGNRLVKGAGCQMYGTISAAQPHSGNNIFDMEEACRVCMEMSDGLMVFDLSHVVAHKWWSKIKSGIVWWRYENEGIEL